MNYQPIIDSRTGAIRSFEALVRWRHPKKGIISPEKFIPVAEETGLINEIGEWVLRTACAEATRWPDTIKLAVNLSPIQFRRSHLPALVATTLAESGLKPNRLELEITETALMDSGSTVLGTLNELKDRGISIALDDFGTGYSSLSYLTMFPFDRIKIDKTFTANIATRSDCAAIIVATVALANGLGIEITAEGVETEAQLRFSPRVGQNPPGMVT